MSARGILCTLAMSTIYHLLTLAIIYQLTDLPSASGYVNLYPAYYPRQGVYSRGYHGLPAAYQTYYPYHLYYRGYGNNTRRLPVYRRTQPIHTTPVAPRHVFTIPAKLQKCYECACTPEYDVYDMRRVAKQVEFRYAPAHLRKRTVYVTKFQKAEEQVGGWQACYGPLTTGQAKRDGVAMPQCGGACYTRIDSNKNLYRGCHTGEFAVDPTMMGCHKQGTRGSTYCFCEGELCNSQSMEDMMEDE